MTRLQSLKSDVVFRRARSDADSLTYFSAYASCHIYYDMADFIFSVPFAILYVFIVYVRSPSDSLVQDVEADPIAPAAAGPKKSGAENMKHDADISKGFDLTFGNSLFGTPAHSTFASENPSLNPTRRVPAGGYIELSTIMTDDTRDQCSSRESAMRILLVTDSLVERKVEGCFS